MKLIKYTFLIFTTITLGLLLGYFLVLLEVEKENEMIGGYCEARISRFWEVQSIDTMKYSRDLAREKLSDELFDKIINKQVADIAMTGATHVAIATPYDKEFIPFLKRWVETARQNKLKVWFRGNLSGWEEWFGYQPITRIEHIVGIRNFILNNPGLFADGDIFSSCPECENGGPGDPRDSRDIDSYRKFLINESQTTKESFAKIGKNVEVNYFSMNGDVAALVMNLATTASLGGIVTVDHYVDSGERLVNDIDYFAKNSQGQTVLGEFGYPIPDINGSADALEQAEWLEDALYYLVRADNLIGLNYWTGVGASSALWNDDGTERKAVEVIRKYYTPEVYCSRVLNDIGLPVQDAVISAFGREYKSNQSGFFRVLIPGGEKIDIRISADFFDDLNINDPKEFTDGIFHLERTDKNWFYNVILFIKKYISLL
jgi:hypothetical protein